MWRVAAPRARCSPTVPLLGVAAMPRARGVKPDQTDSARVVPAEAGAASAHNHALEPFVGQH